MKDELLEMSRPIVRVERKWNYCLWIQATGSTKLTVQRSMNLYTSLNLTLRPSALSIRKIFSRNSNRVEGVAFVYGFRNHLTRDATS